MCCMWSRHIQLVKLFRINDFVHTESIFVVFMENYYSITIQAWEDKFVPFHVTFVMT